MGEIAKKRGSDLAISFPELQPTARLLLGPGPSNVNPRVMRAMVAPVVGHLDPDFVRVMDDIKKLLRTVFQTANEITFPVSGTGSAGMETALMNLVEEGDDVVIAVAGVFGERMADAAGRLGARVHRVEAEWGRVIEPERIEAALKASGHPKLLGIVHAETSTGALQPYQWRSIAGKSTRAIAARKRESARRRGSHPSPSASVRCRRCAAARPIPVRGISISR
jgi:alanine-glyoxylate transaminase/serine-glyoxylate transaminase/serine-pyruvate transaminase